MDDDTRQQIIAELQTDRPFDRHDPNQSVLYFTFKMEGAERAIYVPTYFLNFTSAYDILITYNLCRKWLRFLIGRVKIKLEKSSFVWFRKDTKEVVELVATASRACAEMLQVCPFLIELASWRDDFTFLVNVLTSSISSTSIIDPEQLKVEKIDWNVKKIKPTNLEYYGSIRGYDRIIQKHAFLFEEKIKPQLGSIYYDHHTKMFLRVYYHPFLSDANNDGWVLVFETGYSSYRHALSMVQNLGKTADSIFCNKSIDPYYELDSSTAYSATATEKTQHVPLVANNSTTEAKETETVGVSKNVTASEEQKQDGSNPSTGNTNSSISTDVKSKDSSNVDTTTAAVPLPVNEHGKITTGTSSQPIVLAIGFGHTDWHIERIHRIQDHAGVRVIAMSKSSKFDVI